ncbi:hypothetical protein HNO89_003445 [Sporosarcina luteola]|nr:hypothetical protein [Sporosarcina luteola]
MQIGGAACPISAADAKGAMDREKITPRAIKLLKNFFFKVFISFQNVNSIIT